MSSIEITFQNYRGFAMDNPVELQIEEGITFILGVNNVGKSSLIRAFYELRPFIDFQLLNNSRARQHAIQKSSIVSFDRLINRQDNQRKIHLKLKSGENGWDLEIVPQQPDLHTQDCIVSSNPIGSPTEDLALYMASAFSESMLVGPFRSPAVQITDALYDVQVGRHFINQWDQWANGPRIDHSSQVEQLVRELKELFQFDSFTISVSQATDQLHVTTDDGKFALSELGDGIAHYIIVLGNAMIRKPSFIFIDEPEIGLHPRMQETFVRTLATKAKYGLVATSHSVGLARSVSDRIITLTRLPNGRRVCSPFGEHHPESLIQSISELGYSQYAEIGGNHLLLVEGRTDIKAFREILRKFHLEQHFIIWSLNGSDWLRSKKEKIADELADLRRLNPASISVIFDSERTDATTAFNPAFEDFYDVCRKLKFNIFPTDRHSTENYITQAALDKVAPNHQALGAFEEFGSVGVKWDKTKNWLMFREMRAEDFNGTGLKDFITKTLAPLVKK
jgi:ABC-type cobalamin/Fe3+-siderophores transport system ATPase subunit